MDKDWTEELVPKTFIAGQHRIEVFSVGVSLEGFFYTLEEKLSELDELDLEWLKGRIPKFLELVDEELNSRGEEDV